jgi:hypothetical protein
MLIVNTTKEVTIARPLGKRFSSSQLHTGNRANAKNTPHVRGMKIKLPYHKMK